MTDKIKANKNNTGISNKNSNLEEKKKKQTNSDSDDYSDSSDEEKNKKKPPFLVRLAKTTDLSFYL